MSWLSILQIPPSEICDHDQWQHLFDGNQVEFLRDNNKEKTLKYYYKYDPKGNLIEEIDWANDKTNYKYDDNDNQIEAYTHFADGRKNKETFQYIYDNEGNWIKCVNYDDGEPVYIHERTLNYYQ